MATGRTIDGGAAWSTVFALKGLTVTAQMRIGTLVKEGSAGANPDHPVPLFFNGLEGAGVLAGRGAASFFL